MDNLVSVIIPTFNRKESLIRLINSVLNSTYKNLEIIVIDDASADGTYGIIKKRYPNITIYRNEKEMLLAGSRNVGIKCSKGDFIFLIDDDNIVDKNAISELVKFMKKSKNVIISPLMLYYSYPSTIWCAGGKVDRITYDAHYYYHKKDIRESNLPNSINCDYNPNAYMMSIEIFDIIGLFDEKNFPISWEDTDFFKRAKFLGFSAKTVTSAKIWHDIPLNKHFHINSLRSYYRGKTRITFYLKYVKWRALFSIFDITYFMFVILFSKNENKKSIIVNYIKGMLDGLVRR